MRISKRNQKGFSLIELLIVVAIILIIAAIAIPNLIDSRRIASETAAAANMRTIATVEIQYQQAYPTMGFAPSLAALGPGDGSGPAPEHANLLDSALAAGAKTGYDYTYAVSETRDAYMVLAKPKSTTDGRVMYCIDESGMIKKAPNTAGTTAEVGGCKIPFAGM